MPSISAISSSNTYSLDQQGGIRKDFEALQKALSSSDLAGAQNAFASFLQDIDKSGPAPVGVQTFKTTLQGNLQALAQALHSGNLAESEKALSSIREDFQQIRQGHHHHHHARSARNAPRFTIADTTLADRTGNQNNSTVTDLSVISQYASWLLGDLHDTETETNVDITA